MSDFTDLRRSVLARHLRQHLAGEVRFDPPSRKLYSTDASIYQIEPLGVVLPRSVDDIVATVQIAAEARVPLTARGGGTSLSGQSVGPGLVLDCGKYMRGVLDIDPTARVARVQPGLVLDEFNRAAAVHGLQFGPEVSTSSRATLGGMMGNNSAGSRSLVYGKTIDHVRQMKVVLADGRQTTFGAMTATAWEETAVGRGPDAALYRGVSDLVRRHSAEIRRRFPRILRRVSGYNLDVLNDCLCPTGPNAPAVVGLHQLLVGSEGTLAVLTEAELALIPRPRARGLLVPQFATLADAIAAVGVCLEARPTAVELMDHQLLELAADNLSLRDTMKAIRGRPQAVLMVEFASDDPGEVADRVERLRLRLGGVPGLMTAVAALEPALRDPLWDLRKAAMPLLYGVPGDRKPVTFIEDTAVPPARLPEFVARFRGLLQKHGTDGSFYGHASVGCLHIRPVLDLKKSDEVARMRQITAEVTDLVLSFGGSLSGEHGDGLARSEWNEKMFGSEVYGAFRAIKTLFDPHGQLNPGKIVDAVPMTENLRYPPGYAPSQPPTVYDYSRQEGFVRSVEMCNGSGACRKTQGGAMCPSYRATHDERDSTRGRANALRHALAEGGPGPVPRSLRERWVHDIFDLCLMCKACKAECPSNVDVAKLKAELTQFYYRGRPRPLGHLLMAGLPRFNRLAAPLAPLINRLQRSRPLRWLLEQIAGVDRRRDLPLLHARHLRRWFAHRRPDPAADTAGRVLLLADCFTTYNEPQVGRAAVRVLERAGYGVGLSGFCCGRTLLSKGFLDAAQALVREQAPILARRLADGTPLLGLEPSCLLTLADEWVDLWPGPETRAIAAAVHLADGWLAGRLAEGAVRLTLKPKAGKCLLHGHCHQKALVGVGGTAAALRLLPGLEVRVLDAGCCGMAGSFGYEAEHYDLSVRIANLALLPALAAAPDALVAATGTSCRHQIHDLAGRRARHPLEMIEDQLT